MKRVIMKSEKRYSLKSGRSPEYVENQWRKTKEDIRDQQSCKDVSSPICSVQDQQITAESNIFSQYTESITTYVLKDIGNFKFWFVN